VEGPGAGGALLADPLDRVVVVGWAKDEMDARVTGLAFGSRGAGRWTDRHGIDRRGINGEGRFVRLALCIARGTRVGADGIGHSPSMGFSRARIPRGAP
jgi:hypothetical protein